VRPGSNRWRTRDAHGRNPERSDHDHDPITDRSKKRAGPKLLTGGNPQIPKGEGDGSVQANIAAMPGWKRSRGERLDELIDAVTFAQPRR
jgi:hypothetical protein